MSMLMGASASPNRGGSSSSNPRGQSVGKLAVASMAMLVEKSVTASEGAGGKLDCSHEEPRAVLNLVPKARAGAGAAVCVRAVRTAQAGGNRRLQEVPSSRRPLARPAWRAVTPELAPRWPGGTVGEDQWSMVLDVELNDRVAGCWLLVSETSCRSAGSGMGGKM